MRLEQFFLTLTILVLTGSASGQTPTIDVVTGVTSPYEIVRLVNTAKQNKNAVDLQPIWQRLGVTHHYFEICDRDCVATVSTDDLDGMPGREVVLKLNTTNFCRFLVFTKQGNQ